MAGKITGVNVDGQVYEFVAGQAVTGACSALSTDWVKPLTLPEGTDLVGGLIISVLFLNGNSVGFKGAKTVYSSDGENFYYDQAMTDPVTLPPEGCYSMTLVSGDEYSFSAWPVMTYGGITLPICDSRGYKAGGPLWDAGDTVSIIFYATGYVILAGGEGISMEVYPTLADAEQDLPNLDEGQFIATEEGDNFTVVDVVQKDIPNPVSSNAVAQAMSYSTTEQFTGKYWIDGKPIYRTVFTGLNFGGSTSGWNNTGATQPTGADKLISGYAVRSSDNTVINPFSYKFNNGNIQYTTPQSIGSTDILIIEYTKTSA